MMDREKVRPVSKPKNLCSQQFFSLAIIGYYYVLLAWLVAGAMICFATSEPSHWHAVFRIACSFSSFSTCIIIHHAHLHTQWHWNAHSNANLCSLSFFPHHVNAKSLPQHQQKHNTSIIIRGSSGDSIEG